MNRLDNAVRARVIGCLVEGMGVRPVSRATGVAVNTVQKIIWDLGGACERFHDLKVKNLPCRKIQADEVWAFCYAREKNVPKEHKGEFGYGDVWVWSAICDDTKIVPGWHLGRRTQEDAALFFERFIHRIPARFELNTDGLPAYFSGVMAAISAGSTVDWAKVIKVYKTPNGKWDAKGNRYQQPEIQEIRREAVCGTPDVEKASTSYVERLNLGTRMGNRKMARLTNGHAKKALMLAASMAIHFTWYNWGKGHETLKGRTPAMAAGLTDRRMTLAEFADLLPR